MYSYYVSNTKDEIKIDENSDDDDGSVEDNDNDGESEEQWAASEINQNLVTFEELIN
ncbi:14452_t:CDS:2, partial [Entrophospora sp. SA101]